MYKCSILLAMLAVVVAAIAGPVAADTLVEDFDSLNPDLWVAFAYGNPGPFITEFTNSELRLKKACACGGSGVKGGGLGSKFRLSGDFTITVDFRWSIFSENNQAQINVSIPGVGFRYDMGVGKGVDVSTGSIIYYNFVPSDGYIRPFQRVGTLDTHGTLRLQRVGAIFSAFYRSPGSSTFTQIPRDVHVTSADIQFQLILQNNYINNVSEVFYDNLVIEADAILGLPLPGSVAGTVSAACPESGTPLYGVAVDLYDMSTGPAGTVRGDLAGSAVTDASGNYVIEGLPAADYLVSIQEPLGYEAAVDEIMATVIPGTTSQVDFSLSCIPVVADAHGAGFWKHQVGAATSGKGNGQIEAATLCGYLDEVETHFNSNAINQVLIYVPPPSGLCSDKLEVARELLNLKGNVGMAARAKKELMTLLLNVAAGFLGLSSDASEDGATISQAITYCDNLLDDPEGDHELAKNIAETINSGSQVGSGLIPLETASISYRSPIALGHNYPNPLGSQTVIHFRLDTPGDYSVSIYGVAGRLIRSFSGRSGGNVSVSWDAKDNLGRSVSPGVYYYRVQAAGVTKTSRMIVTQ